MLNPASLSKAPKATKHAAKGNAGLLAPFKDFKPLKKACELIIHQGIIFLHLDFLEDLQKSEKKTIILVEQNAKKGLEFADIGYVLVSGQTAIAGKGDDLLKNPDVGRLFLGG